MSRTLVLRLYGFAVAVVTAAAAVRLLAYSLDLNDRFLADALRSAGDVAGEALSEGAAMLLGVAVLAISALSAYLVLRPERTHLIRIMKGKSGKAYLEPGSLARSVQRTLRRDVHPQIDVNAKGRRLVATAPYRSTVDPREIVNEVAEQMPTELQTRGVAKLRYRVGVGRPAKGRVR